MRKTLPLPLLAMLLMLAACDGDKPGDPQSSDTPDSHGLTSLKPSATTPAPAAP